MKLLMDATTDAINNAAFTHKLVPLTWFQAMDQMSDLKRDCLSLKEVLKIALQCDMQEAEVPLFLSFLHDMGHLMWIDEAELVLRDVVILDPISYLVTPATFIICKLSPDKNDPTHHFMESHNKCNIMHKKEWAALTRDDVLHKKLLPILWSEYTDHIHILLLLMTKFGMLVPLRSAKVSNSVSSSISSSSSISGGSISS